MTTPHEELNIFALTAAALLVGVIGIVIVFRGVEEFRDWKSRRRKG